MWEKIKLNQVTLPEGRYYEDYSGRYSSVTTILSSDQSSYQAKSIKNWAKKEIDAGRNPNRYSKDGDIMHKYIEEDILNKESQYDFDCRGYRLFQVYKEYFLDKNTFYPLLVEGQVKCDVEGRKFAGTVDLVSEEKDGVIITDHKSSKNFKNINRKLKRYFMQIAAYAKAIKEMYGVVVSGARIAVATEDGFKEYRANIEEIKRYWEEFDIIMQKFYLNMDKDWRDKLSGLQ